MEFLLFDAYEKLPNEQLNENDIVGEFETEKEVRKAITKLKQDTDGECTPIVFGKCESGRYMFIPYFLAKAKN